MEEIERARREGYQRGLAVSLFWLGATCALYTSATTAVEAPRDREVFEQVKVPMPGMTVMVLESYALVSIGLLLGAAFSAFITFARKLDPTKTSLFNAALFIAAMTWAALTTFAMKLPFLSLLQGIGKGRAG